MEQKNTGICLQAFIPLRKEPAEQAEMISQVVFGEVVEIIEELNNWLYVKVLFDNYEGWLDRKTLSTQVESIHGIEKAICIKNSILVSEDKTRMIPVPVGSVLFKNPEKPIQIKQIQYYIDKPGGFLSINTGTLNEIAYHIIGAPYIWGGRTGYGFDCSGLSQYVMRTLGKAVPRDASLQAKLGQTINFMNDIRTGDLAFFDNEEGLITHVGVIMNSTTILHASGKVRIDRLDQQGIFNEEMGKYTYQLRIIKRI